MDAWIIILVVLIFVVIYAMYMITTTSTLIKAMSPLKAAIEIKPTDSGNKIMIPSPTSQNYYYEAWIYLTDTTKTPSSITEETKINPSAVSNILGRLDDTTNDVALTVFKNTTTKKYTLCVLFGKTNTAEATPYFVTEDLPTHKWVHLVMNVSGKLVEVYVNGKLLRTIYLAESKPRSVTSSIRIGNSSLDGYITRAIRKPENIDAQKVWDQYLIGNGQYGGAMYGMLDYINSYAFKMNITSNGKVQREFTAQIGGTETN